MTTLRIDTVSMEEADALAASLALPLRPGTLYGAYLRADAARDALLQPTWLAVRDGHRLWLHGIHRRPIEGTPWWDASAPYGYGGPLCHPEADPAFIAAAWRTYTDWMRAHGVVVEYLRFHPLLANERHYGGQTAPNREVVWVDLCVDDLMTQYAPRLRGTLKKTARLALRYAEQPLATCAGAFAAYYRRGMMEIGADPFFQFQDAYFEALAGHPGARVGICRAASSDAWLAACLMIDGIGMTEYHLAATSDEGRAVGASSHALHAAALAARARGQRVLYLGGGSDTRPDNPLLFFKAGFSKRRATYHTGFYVFDPAAHAELRERFPAAWAAHPQRPIFYRKV